MSIVARFDGSYRHLLDGSYNIGIGYTIKDNNLNVLCNNSQYELANEMNSYFAESVAMIELLEKLEEYQNQTIEIIGDCKILIEAIDGKINGKSFFIQCQYIKLLLLNLREKNNVFIKWEQREQNKECDKLSKIKKTFSFYYKNSNNKCIKIKLKSHTREDAYIRFVKLSQKILESELSTKKRIKNVC